MSDLFYNLAFLILATLTAGSAILVVWMRNLLHAAVALFFSLTGVAGLYILLGADFLGVTQLLIYAGGVLVLIVFGVFLTARIYGANVEIKEAPLPLSMGIGLSAFLFAMTVSIIVKTEWPTQKPNFEPTVHRLGELFLTQFILPFELISVLLLFVLVGAIVLVKKEMEGNS